MLCYIVYVIWPALCCNRTVGKVIFSENIPVLLYICGSQSSVCVRRYSTFMHITVCDSYKTGVFNSFQEYSYYLNSIFFSHSNIKHKLILLEFYVIEIITKWHNFESTENIYIYDYTILFGLVLRIQNWKLQCAKVFSPPESILCVIVFFCCNYSCKSFVVCLYQFSL